MRSPCFFCGTPTPGLENLGLQTPTLALKNLISDCHSDSRTYYDNDYVLKKDDFIEILNSSNDKCTVV